jgi:hypothetical protein
LYAVCTSKLLGAQLLSTTEFYVYAGGTSDSPPPWSVVQSFDHDASAGAFRSWCNGGIISTATDQLASGRVRSYKAALESATYWCFMERSFTVASNDRLTARVWMRSSSASGDMPRVQIIDPALDPLIDATKTALDEEIAPAAADTWVERTVTITNTATYPKQYTLRFLARGATGNAWFDFDTRQASGKSDMWRKRW